MQVDASLRAPLDRATAPETGLRVDDVIEARDGRDWRLRGSAAPAIRAVSCLVEPLPGDRVLVMDIASESYVLAVLERPGLGDATLSLPDGAGKMTLKAQTVTVDAASALELRAPETTIRTASLRMMAGTLAWIGRAFTLLGDRLTTSVRNSETVADSLSTMAATRLSVIERIDSEHIGAKVTTIATVAATQVQSSATAAKDDIRLDAKRITLG